MNSTPYVPLNRKDLGWLGGFGLLKFLIHLPVLTRYGSHHDELYFLACGRHLSFGYVDHAPIVPWMARLADSLFGQSLFGLRLLSLLAGVATVFFTGLLTRRLGGGRFAQAVACLAVIIAPIYLRTNNMLNIPAFEQPLWILGIYLLVRIIQEDRPKLWLWLGAAAGAGLMIKHSMFFFGFGLVAGLAHEGPAAYSSLAQLKDGRIGLLYERGEKRAYELITFARFDHGWLEGGK